MDLANLFVMGAFNQAERIVGDVDDVGQCDGVRGLGKYVASTLASYRLYQTGYTPLRADVGHQRLRQIVKSRDFLGTHR